MGYVYDVLKNHFIWIDTLDEGIPQLMWHITNKCLLDCKFCFSIKNTDELTIEDLNKYIQKFCALKIQKIDIAGGEPLLCRYFVEICEALFEAGIYITVTTRAAGLESNAKWVLDNWKRFARIIVSVDVPLLKPFVELTGNKDVWGKTTEFLRRLKEKQCTNVRVNTVVTPYLLDEVYLCQLEKMVSQCCCKEWCLIEPHPANKKETFDQVKISHAQFLNIVEKAEKLSEERLKYHLLVREQMNYTDYWVLYPNGILAKHTDGERDIANLPFLYTSNDSILYMVKDKIWVPEEKI